MATHDVYNIDSLEEARDSRQIIAQHSWTYGNGADDIFHVQKPGNETTHSQSLGALLQLQRKRHERKVRAKARLWFNLFGPKLLDLEIAIRVRSKAWISPSVECRISAINIRPSDAPIFKACYSRNLPEVKLLLESGEASVNDVSEEGRSLLAVSART